jgi:hypothetical protein
MWRFVKIPKIIALLAFALPWMTVSCSGTKIAEATGAELVVGKIRPLIADANRAVAEQPTQTNWYLVAAIVLIVIGLIVSFLAKRYAAVVIGTSIAALIAVFAGTNTYTQKIAAAGARANGGGSSMSGNRDMDQMSQMAASMIHVDWQIGYWITMLCLVAAAVLSFLALGDRRTPPTL